MLSQRRLPPARMVRLLDALDNEAPADALTSIIAPGDALPRVVGAALPGEALTFVERSGTGAIVFSSAQRALVVRPPFPVERPATATGYRTSELRSLLTPPAFIGAVLLRFGGYAVGVYEAGRLVAARNDARFVKNRHRKGGQSQRRFDRIREKQIDELFDHCCRDSVALLEPYRGRLNWLVYGGDGHTVQAFLKTCPSLAEFPASVLPRFLAVPEPRHATLESLLDTLLACELLEYQPVPAQ